MSHTTPGRNAPRHSGIPAPGTRSGIPMPGSRPRSSTGSNTMAAPRSGADTEAMSRALADAIRANDPGRYSGSDNLSPQFSASGRRSVAGLVRPPSAASTSSAMSSRVPSEAQRIPARSKTPVSAAPRSAYTPRASLTSRPESRASNVGRSLSRAGHEFEVGDAVRIESLGMEGTLQFMGEIEGKSGVWAGVELAPNFAGRGKNDGSVNGIHYFTCAPKCGVFTLPNKLSAASTGRNGARPVSVASMASSHGGRVTPSISGRTTPSHAPAPRSMVTPQANTRKKPTLDTTNLDSTVTAGSRASKYVGVTARELGTRTDNPSPTRSASTPQGTPKAPRSLPTPRARPSLGLATPKAGRPLNSMPPPALPMSSPRRPIPRQNTITPTLSQGSSETFVDDAGEHAQNGHSVMSMLDMNNQAIQDKIALLMSSNKASASPISAGPDSHMDLSESVLGSPIARRTPDSTALEARIARLERENEALKAEVTAKAAAIEEEGAVLNAAIERAVALEDEKNAALARATELERTHEKAVKERTEQVEGLERAVQDAEKARVEVEARIKEEEQKRTEADALVVSLKEALAGKATVEEEQAAGLKAKNDEIALLEGRVQRLDTDLQFERREMGQQIDELRQAGQETIALYEERISVMEARRYELEDLVAELEAKAAERAASPGTVARHASTAAEIDNESLREQVSHMQRRLGVLEDQLEDARAQAEREESAANARVGKAKEGEAAARKECMELRREVDGLRKEDEKLRLRVEELVEALRENAVTLEGARADVEGLRAEVADLEGLKTASADAAGDAPSVETAKDAAVVQLRRELEEARKAAEASERTELELHEQLETLEREKAELEQIVEATTIRQTADQKLIAELQERALRQVGSREQLRASSERLRTVSSNEQLRAETPDPRRDSVDSDSSKTSRLSGGPGKREQIAGLKHIISGLEEEIRQWVSKCAMLEQENKLLESGTEQLQVAMRRLEATIDDRLGKDAEGEAGAGSDGERIKRIETENELMKTRITDMEQKHARAVLDLNKEITELENLVESKIYREDDLERELERYKEKLARLQRSSSKLSGESMLVNGNSSGTIRAKTSGPRPDISLTEASGAENMCELCESKDHDGMDCPLLNDNHVDDSAPASKQKSALPAMSSQWCEDCEEFGHTVENCPSTQDVF